MKISLIAILLIAIICPYAYCIFSNTTVSNFTITGITEPNKITLDFTATKFVVWNNNADIRMYYSNGTLVCFNSFVKQIQRILWPKNYPPILLAYPGQEYSTLNDTTCQVIRTYNILTFMDISSKTQIFQLNYALINEIPYLALSTMGALYVVDMNSVTQTAIFTALDPTLPRYQTSVYSNDLKYLYIVKTDPLTGNRSILVFNANQTTGKPFAQIKFNTSVLSLAPSSDNKTIICVGSYMNNNTTNVYRFNTLGNFSIKASRQRIGKTISIGEGNVVVMFKNHEGSIEVIRSGDGKSLQNFTYTTVTDFYDADYKNKVLIVLDGMGRVVTYTYEPDADVKPFPDPDPGPNPNPNPDPVPDEGFPLWIIFVTVGAALLIIAGVLLFLFRKKIFRRGNNLPRYDKQSLISNKLAYEDERRPVQARHQEKVRRSMAGRGEEEHYARDDEQAPVYVPPLVYVPPPAPRSSFRRVAREEPQEKPEERPAAQRPRAPNFFAVKPQLYDDGADQFKRDLLRD